MERAACKGRCASLCVGVLDNDDIDGSGQRCRVDLLPVSVESVSSLDWQLHPIRSARTLAAHLVCRQRQCEPSLVSRCPPCWMDGWMNPRHSQYWLTELSARPTHCILGARAAAAQTAASLSCTGCRAVLDVAVVSSPAPVAIAVRRGVEQAPRGRSRPSVWCRRSDNDDGDVKGETYSG